MFEKLEKNKVFRDPLYGNIQVEYKIIWDLINTKEVQRLRRISQLSGVTMVFHTAEHSRFSHAIGTYHIANRMIHEVEDLKNKLSEYEKVVFLIASLLHDIGHGPFSHAFEKVSTVKHEMFTVMMIENEITEVNKILSKHKNLVKDVISIIKHSSNMPLVEALVSSQLDVDRLDYLNRDATNTGATYGMVDVDRIIRVMSVKDNKICYRAKGVHAIENYLMSRYHMYWQIYYHPVAKSYDIILESIYKRIKDLTLENVQIEADVKSLTNVFKNGDLKSYIDVDDAYINGVLKVLTKSSDKILKDLSNRFMNRKLFKYVTLKTEEEKNTAIEISKKYLSSEILSKYYYKEVSVSQVTYLSYMNSSKEDDINNILILQEDGKLVPLEEYSLIVKGLLESGKNKETKIFYGTFDEENI